MLGYKLKQSEETVLKMPRWIANKRIKQYYKFKKDMAAKK